MSTYAGESVGKKVARAVLYESIANLSRPDGSIVALAGRGAHDLDPIRAFGLAKRPDEVCLVDTEQEGLDAAEKKWPGVHTRLGWMHEVDLPAQVSVAVLDFCGMVESRESRAAIRSLRGRLRIGSIVAVTYSRGRETPDSVVGGMAGGKNDLGGAANRFLAALNITGTELGVVAGRLPRSPTDWVLTHAGLIEYVGHKHPMGIFIGCLQRAARLPFLRSVQPVAVSFLRGDPRPRVVKLAAQLEARGVDPAMALSVSPGTLVAWRAHATRGTYLNDELAGLKSEERAQSSARKNMALAPNQRRAARRGRFIAWTR